MVEVDRKAKEVADDSRTKRNSFANVGKEWKDHNKQNLIVIKEQNMD